MILCEFVVFLGFQREGAETGAPLSGGPRVRQPSVGRIVVPSVVVVSYCPAPAKGVRPPPWLGGSNPPVAVFKALTPLGRWRLYASGATPAHRPPCRCQARARQTWSIWTCQGPTQKNSPDGVPPVEAVL